MSEQPDDQPLYVYEDEEFDEETVVEASPDVCRMNHDQLLSMHYARHR